MNKIFKIKAEIQVNKEGGRTWPITTGYRPGFNFINNMQTSGAIDLLSLRELKPGEQGVVEISFGDKTLLGDISLETKFKFYEGPIEIGIGQVLEVIGWVDTALPPTRV